MVGAGVAAMGCRFVARPERDLVNELSLWATWPAGDRSSPWRCFRPSARDAPRPIAQCVARRVGRSPVALEGPLTDGLRGLHGGGRRGDGAGVFGRAGVPPASHVDIHRHVPRLMRLCDSPTPRRWRSIWGGAQDIGAVPTVGRAVYSPVVTSVRLPRSTPQAQGVDATGVADLVVSAQAHNVDLHGLMIARHGRVIAQGSWRPYRPQLPTLVYSMSKALTATAIAMAEHDGLLRLGDPILDHLDLDPRSVSADWSEVTVEHCLSMTVGYDAESSGLVHDRMGAGDRVGDEDWLHRVLSSPPTSEPGSVFHYCQAPTYLLSRYPSARHGPRAGRVPHEPSPRGLSTRQPPLVDRPDRTRAGL